MPADVQWYQGIVVEQLVGALHSAGFFTDVVQQASVTHIHIKTKDWKRPHWRFKCGHIKVSLAGTLDYGAIVKDHETIFRVCQSVLGSKDAVYGSRGRA